MRIVILAGSGIGFLIALAVIYVVTYRPTKEYEQSVSTGWIEEQIRGRRN